MSEISKRPWKIVEGSLTLSINDAQDRAVSVFMMCDKADAEHIVKCVNEHDALLQEVEEWKKAYQIENKLKHALSTQIYYSIIDEDMLKKELEASQKLSEERRLALKKLGDTKMMCIYCGVTLHHEDHKPDCDHVRLIKKEDSK